MTYWDGTRGDEGRKARPGLQPRGEEGGAPDRERKKPCEVVIFPVVKRPVPMAETAPDGEPSPATIVLVDLFDVRAELQGPIGDRQLVLFEGGVARVRIRPEYEAMGLANAISIFPDDGHRAAVVVGMIAIAMVPVLGEGAG